MRDHVRLLFGLVAIALAIPGAAEEGKVGIVLLHGKQSKAPHGAVGSLAQKLKGAGYLVAIPEMPWSRDRIYGASYEDALGRLGVGFGAVILMTGLGIAVLFFYYRPTIGNLGARFSSLYSECAD